MKRNASGVVSDGSGGTLLPILGGIAGGAAAVAAAEKWSAHPAIVAATTAVAGLGVMAYARKQRSAGGQQFGVGAVVGAAVVGAVPLLMDAMPKSRPHAVASSAGSAPRPPVGGVARSAEGDGFITRQELNDALDKMADSHKQGQQQQTCDLLGALREEIRKVVAETPRGLSTATDTPAASLPARQPMPSFTYPFESTRQRANPAREADGEERDASGDEYMRSAHGDDVEDGAGDEYEASAHGTDIGDVAAYHYARNAQLDDSYEVRGADADERDADSDERDGDADERDADADERDADGDERDADADERDADGDERDADGESD